MDRERLGDHRESANTHWTSEAVRLVTIDAPTVQDCVPVELEFLVGGLDLDASERAFK